MKVNPIAHGRVLNYAYTDIDTLFRDFHISGQGYSDEQLEESRIQYGKNSLSGRASDTVLYRLGRTFLNPFTIILFVLACISFLTDVVLASNFSRNVTTVVIILCMLLISGAVRFAQELRAKRVADHLTGMIASTVLVRRNGAQWYEAIPRCLEQELRAYIRRCGLLSGPVFVTRNGKAMSRTQVTAEIQSLSRDARVEAAKCTPRGLQRLYRATQAEIENDIRLLTARSYEQMLNTEQLAVGWENT